MTVYLWFDLIFNFISDLVKYTAWPIFSLIVFFWLKKLNPDVLTMFKKMTVDVHGIKFDLEKDLEKAKESIQPLPITEKISNQDKLPEVPSESNKKDSSAFEMIAFEYPEASVFISWQNVEAKIFSTIEEYNLDVYKIFHRDNDRSRPIVARYKGITSSLFNDSLGILVHLNWISKVTASNIMELRRVRNSAVHAIETGQRITTEEALNFERLTDTVIKRIDDDIKKRELK